MLRSIMALGLVLPLIATGAEQCDIGDIGDVVVTFDVSVTNGAADPVSVTVSTPDVSRNAVLRPGASITLTTFSPGELIVTAGPAPGPEAIRRLKEISDRVVSEAMDPAEAVVMQQAIAAIIRERVGAAALIADEGCSMDLQPDKEGRGVDVRYTIGANAESWVIEGPGC